MRGHVLSQFFVSLRHAEIDFTAGHIHVHAKRRGIAHRFVAIGNGLLQAWIAFVAVYRDRRLAGLVHFGAVVFDGGGL